MKKRKFKLKKKFSNAIIGLVVIFVTVMGVACVNAASNSLGLSNSNGEEVEVEKSGGNREIIVRSGDIGDILQYANNGEWVHSVIITQVIKVDQENVLDYLINSNTTDRINYPASAYGYSELRLIKILGWNEE